MIKGINKIIHSLFAWCPLYKSLAGGYRYYLHLLARQYRAEQFHQFGNRVSLGDNLKIRAPHKIQIGDGVFIGHSCILDAVGGIKIGSFCALANHATIITIDHHVHGAESIPWGNARIIKPVILEDYVWLGMHASVLPGVTIGEGAIIGLGAVVAKNVPTRAIVVGNPGRIIGYRDESEFKRLKKTGAVKYASSRCEYLIIPEEIKAIHYNFLTEIGFDLDSNQKFFNFVDRH